jgi:hypothetical protein
LTKLNLNAVWGKKYGVDTFKTSETVEFLKGQQIELEPRPQHHAGDITVYSGDKNEAATSLPTPSPRPITITGLSRHTQGDGRRHQGVGRTISDRRRKLQEIQTKSKHCAKNLTSLDTDPNTLGPSPTYTQQQLQQYQEMVMEGQTRYDRLNDAVDPVEGGKPRTKSGTFCRQSIPTRALGGLLDKLITRPNSHLSG